MSGGGEEHSRREAERGCEVNDSSDNYWGEPSRTPTSSRDPTLASRRATAEWRGGLRESEERGRDTSYRGAQIAQREASGRDESARIAKGATRNNERDNTSSTCLEEILIYFFNV